MEKEKNMKIEDVDVNMKNDIIEEDGFIFINPITDSRFKVEGLGFFEKEKDYFRLLKDCKDKVTDAVYWLSSHPSGGQIHFHTNSSKIKVKVKNKGDYQMCHMAATGQQGVDLYYRLNQQKNYKFFKCATFASPTTQFESDVFFSDKKMEKDIIINLPLYEGLEELLIGIEKDATLKLSKSHKNKGKIVVYGTSLTQGGCASRPGMSFTNILSRRLDTEFINLGFSGSGLGENIIAQLINQIDDIKMLILDYDANGGATGDLKNNMEDFIDTFRSKYPTLPILIMSKPKFSSYLFMEKEVERRKFYVDFQKNVALKRKEKGDHNIYFLDGNILYGKKDWDECLVDGIHATDLGFYRIANVLEKELKKILKQ